jgi:hypothetical protein
MLIITNTYTANLAAFLTVDTLQTNIRTLSDLRGRNVGTLPSYVEQLRKRNIQTVDSAGAASPHAVDVLMHLWLYDWC